MSPFVHPLVIVNIEFIFFTEPVMKRTHILPMGILFSLLSLTSVFATVEDTSILDELVPENIIEISTEAFTLQSVTSCDNLETITNDFLKDYKGQPYYKRGQLFFDDAIDIQEMSMEDSADVSAVSAKTSNRVAQWGGSDDFSGTNEQVVGVSESEIVKTDGEYIYYLSDYYDQERSESNYQDRQHKNIYIIHADTLKIVKKIALPKHFWGTQLYLKNDTLVILATGQPSWKFQSQFWDQSQKTYTILYDVSNPAEAEMKKVFMSEGNFSKSRLIDDQLYVISQKNMYSYFYALEDKQATAESIIPRGLEIIATDDEAKKNVEIRWETKNYNVNSGYVTQCADIEYILPDSESDLGYPGMHLVTQIDISDIEKSADTKLIFGNISEVYMSVENLYLTSSVYKTQAFSCPAGRFCISPWYRGWTNHTLVHKMNIQDSGLEYQTSTLLPWNPLTQYSMDEYNWDFRILTSTNRWNSEWEESHTDLYILDEDLELKSSLLNLWAWEDFKSSRYIGEKLFLVTFEQVDPLFAIDLSDSENPEVLGELKIPGYSTYLHPYDENHLIGLGYDTIGNKWGGITNGWVKVDLYKINYDKQCGDTGLSDEENKKCESGDYKGIIVEQLQTQTFWENGSYSEALNNPRMFVWNADDNLLLLPANLYKNDSTDIYNRIDFFSGVIAMNIFPSGISEKYKITHIDTSTLSEKRAEDCQQYITPKEPEECSELFDGTTYCAPKRQTYVPNYCYADTSLNEYFADRSWNYSNYFMKRTLWIGDEVFALSDKKITSHNRDTGVENLNTDLK